MSHHGDLDIALANALREHKEEAHAAFIESFIEEGRLLSDREVRTLEGTAAVVEREYSPNLASEFRAFIERYTP